MELKDQLTALQGEMKSYVDKANEEKSQFGTLQTETKSALEKLQTQLDAVDMKIVAQHAAAIQGKSLMDVLKENETFERVVRNRKGSASIDIPLSMLERKTVITSAAVGAATSGVLQIDRIPGIVAEARQELRIRDLLSSRPTSNQIVDFVRVVTPLSPAGMVPETTLKPENAVTFGVVSEKVRTIATFIPASKQVMSDFPELSAFLEQSLPYYVNLEEEIQLLAGDNTGENLHGLIPQAQASAYTAPATTTPPTPSAPKIDQIGYAIQQIALNKETPPTFVVLNTVDWWSIRLSKDSQGRYIFGDPQVSIQPQMFGLTVVPTTSIAAGTYLVGSGLIPAAEIRDREEMTVEISTEHADFFQRNMIAIRAEKRVALLVKRPNAFVSGTFK